MSTARADAMAALRDWSTPGRRAALVGAAWLAGENNIVALAEAARTSRPTVYADLRTQGIVPEQRPKEHDMTTPVVINGLTGLDLESDGRIILDATRRYAAEHPGGRGIVEFEGKSIYLQAVLRVYNTLRPLLVAEERARADRDRALHLVEAGWEGLTSAANWLGAHHAYVVAVDEARTAISAWATAAADAADAEWFRDDAQLAVYEERILAAGHPPLRRLPSPNSERDELLRRLDETHAHRRTLTAQTLGLATEAGTR
ncbi:hypothetical protein [Streptomyces lunalinharesii]|uniref:Uncharacterized protein n=1 Tax=Streptomyces lunalinharesii TaxID=333384 RepID=A0ABN3SXK8_9ACTN